MNQREPTQTQNQTVNPSTNKFDVFRSVVNLAVQVLTVVGLCLGAYITIRLSPILANLQSLDIKVSALEQKVQTMDVQETQIAVMSNQLTNNSAVLADIKREVEETKKLVIQHISR